MLKIIDDLKLTPLYEFLLPIVQRKELYNWYRRGKIPPTPELIKQSVIKEYALKYSVHNFIETGTYLGSTVNASKNTFKKIITIELDKKLFDRAKKKFTNFKHILLLFGDSAKILPKVLSRIKQPALFWLDAHFSDGITAKGELDTPIIAEVRSILNHKIKGHIILIDDASSFTGQNDYPTISKLKRMILKSYPKGIFRIQYNIIRIILIP